MCRTHAIEHTVHFISEKRTELYQEYCERVSELKNVLCAKSSFKRQALPDLERSGA